MIDTLLLILILIIDLVIAFVVVKALVNFNKPVPIGGGSLLQKHTWSNQAGNTAGDAVSDNGSLFGSE